jgi:hypothetical protein
MTADAKERALNALDVSGYFGLTTNKNPRQKRLDGRKISLTPHSSWKTQKRIASQFERWAS